MSSCSIKGKEWRAGETSFEHDQDVLMPGFRFHPTEEELVEFYLRRKVEGKHFNIELITSIDLYRYDPWELPALASIGEKEWFFYVKRDRKYRNGDRPNRVTKSGYWKATGADRMILKEFSGCIGSKKTLVFYKGKAPKGKRTGWIMNEYRLPRPQSQRIEKSELSLCRVYERSGGSEDGRQRAKQRHKRTENQENNEMYQCQTYQTCSNLPRTYCNVEIKEAGKGEIVKLQEILTGSKAMPKSVMEEKRFGDYMEPAVTVPMEYKVPDQSENIPERIYTDDRNVWSTPCGPVAINEDHELSLTTCFMCPRAPDQLAMAEDLYNITPSNLVLTNALTYGTCLPTYSDKLWEWNAERNNGNGAFY